MTRREPCPVCSEPVDPRHAVMVVHPRDAVVHHACHAAHLAPHRVTSDVWCPSCRMQVPGVAVIPEPHQPEDHDALSAEAEKVK